MGVGWGLGTKSGQSGLERQEETPTTIRASFRPHGGATRSRLTTIEVGTLSSLV